MTWDRSVVFPGYSGFHHDIYVGSGVRHYKPNPNRPMKTDRLLVLFKSYLYYSKYSFTSDIVWEDYIKYMKCTNKVYVTQFISQSIHSFNILKLVYSQYLNFFILDKQWCWRVGKK